MICLLCFRHRWSTIRFSFRIHQFNKQLTFPDRGALRYPLCFGCLVLDPQCDDSTFYSLRFLLLKVLYQKVSILLERKIKYPVPWTNAWVVSLPRRIKKKKKKPFRFRKVMFLLRVSCERRRTIRNLAHDHLETSLVTT